MISNLAVQRTIPYYEINCIKLWKKIYNHYLSGIASLGSQGVDELRWKKPARPGDTLSLRVTVLETKRSRSKPDRGVLTSFIEVLNQKHCVVMSMKAISDHQQSRGYEDGPWKGPGPPLLVAADLSQFISRRHRSDLHHEACPRGNGRIF